MIPKFSMILLFGLIYRCKRIKAGEGNVRMSFRTQRWHVPSRNHEPSWGKLRFARSLHQTLSQFGQKITAACWGHVMTPSQVSWFSDVFWIYKNFKTKFLNVLGNQQCPGVWNSFPFLAWDLSMHPRTHIWDFNQFICTWACACSSNLNCSPEMARKPINV